MRMLNTIRRQSASEALLASQPGEARISLPATRIDFVAAKTILVGDHGQLG